ncbi:MAG TPA: hypothetical protein VMK82_00740 [Steroidobacteraceae bacterium]|nr:hypothetical protein [Steroidobacteraceae bacterium]
MKAALQVVRTCFGLVPLQRWLNGISGALIAMSVGAAILGTGLGFIGLGVAGLLGLCLIALAPGFCGGAMLRYGLSLTLLHLRPHGRARLLLGATLAITLLATVAALPVTIVQPQITRSIAGGGLELDSNLALQVSRSFLIAWNVVAIFWVATFAITASRIATIVAWLALMGAPVVGKLLDRVIPVDALPQGSAGLLLAIGPMTWMLLVLWCLKARSIRPMAFHGILTLQRENEPSDTSASSRSKRVDNAPSTIDVRQKPPTRLFATFWYLNGSGSIAGAAAAGAGVALSGVLVFGVLIPFPTSGGAVWPGPSWLKVPALYLPAFAAIAALVGRLLALRARHLWLRAGMDRASLFHLTEKYCLLITGLTLGGGAAVLLPLSLIQQPDIAASVFTYGAATCALVVCMVYVGLSAWSYSFIQLGLGVIALFLYRLPSILPQPNASPAAALGTIMMFALLVFPLRWYARRRWSKLDWHAWRLPTMARRAA